MEQERGISITVSALEIEYGGLRINLLDTPGHQDFTEDTYRTLMVADSAVMVLDSAKGIETQTEKLFQVCRMQSIPILTADRAWSDSRACDCKRCERSWAPRAAGGRGM